MDAESVRAAQQQTYVDLELEQRLGLGPLTPAERLLLGSLRSGDSANVLRLSPAGNEGRGRVRAALIRQIMLGLAVPLGEIDPHGLQLTWAHVVDRLDLDDVTSPLSLSFHHCILSQGVTLARASIPRIRCTGVTTITADLNQVPFDATSATIAQDLILECEVHATGGSSAAVSLSRAHIGGHLDCTSGTFTNSGGPALVADGMRTESSVGLEAWFKGSGEKGAVRLLNTHIGGQLNCTDGIFTNTIGGPALVADGMHTDSDAFLRAQFEGSGEKGAVRLLNTHIGGHLDCRGGTFTNPTGPAVGADGMRTDSDTFLGARFEGSGDEGAVRLLSAHISGALDCRGGTFINPTGPALVADWLRTDSSVGLEAWFEGSGEQSAVSLLNAHIGGDLDCRGGTFANPTGPALAADGLRTEGHAILAAQFEGSGEHGAVRLSGAHIGGQLQCLKVAGLRSATAGALRLQGATVQRELFLSPNYVTRDTPARWLALDGLTYMGLPLVVSTDGKRKDPDLRVWRDLLSKHTTSYAAQPWQHLAAAHRAAGHEKSAKRLLIDQQDDRRNRVIRGDNNRPHPWTWIRRNMLMRGSKTFTGYGYKTSWTLLWLLGWTGVGVGVSLSTQLVDTQTTYVKTGETGVTVERLPAAVHGRLTATAGEPCSTGELIGLGLEWALPIVKTGASANCVLNTTDPAGQWMNAASWGVQAGGWALATLVIAGYTGIVRRL